jgi:hypothetical protein
MRRKYLVWFQCFITFICCNSCETNTKYELPDVVPVLAILSSNDPDNLFQVRVTIAKPFEDELYPVNADNHVKLFENGNLFAELMQDTILDNSENIHDKSQGYPQRIFIMDPEVKFTSGKEYKIEVSVPEYPTLSATTTIPDPVKIKSISKTEFDGGMPYRFWYYNPVDLLAGHSSTSANPPLIEWTITFDDPPAEKNYYRIGVRCRALLHKDDSISYFVDGMVGYSPVNSNDPIYMYVINRSPNRNINPNDIYHSVFTKQILFSDNNFDGNEFSVTILTPRPSDIQKITDENDTFNYIINLYSLSEDYYKYWLDRYRAEKLYDDPFSEPVRVHSNISNGAGIFAFSSFDSDTVLVDIRY